MDTDKRFSFSDFKYLIIFVGVLLLLLHKGIGANRYLIADDMFYQHYILLNYLFSHPGPGSIPYWLPGVFAGFPLFANAQIGFFYPLTYLLPTFLLPPIYMGINIFVHAFLGAAFMYLYTRRIGFTRLASCIGGIVFTGNGFFLQSAASLSIMNTYIWLPLILFFLEGAFEYKRTRDIFWAGFFWGIMFLGGMPHFAYLASLMIIFYVMVYKHFQSSEKGLPKLLKLTGVISLAGLIALGIFSIQLFPVCKHLPLTARALMEGVISNRQIPGNTLGAETLSAFFFPNFFGAAHAQANFTAPFIGVVVFLIISLLFFTKKDLKFYFYGSVCLAVILLATWGNMFHYLGRIIPLSFLFIKPVRIISVLMFAISVLTAYGADCLLKNSIGYFQRKDFYIYVVMSIALIGLAGLIYMLLFSAQDSTGFLQQLQFGDLGAFTFFGLFFLLIIFSYWTNNISERDLRILLISAVVVSLFFPGTSVMKTRRGPDVFTEGKDLDCLNFLQGNQGLFRIYHYSQAEWPFWDCPNVLLKSNVAISCGQHSFSGFLGLPLRRYVAFTKLDERISPLAKAYTNFLRNRTALELSNCKYFIFRAGEDIFNRNKDFTLAFTSKQKERVYEFKYFLPRLFLVHDYRCLPSPQNVLAVIRQEKFDPVKTVLLEAEDQHWLGQDLILKKADMLKESVQLKKYQPNCVEVEVVNEQAGFLVFLDAYYPGWKVLIDAAPAKILRADYLFRAVFLKPGVHKIEFIYVPVFLFIGAFVTLTTIIASFIILIVDSRTQFLTRFLF